MKQEYVKMMIDSMDCEQSRFASKALDFYDGKQLNHMINQLNDQKAGRKSWQERGMVAMFRNLTASIIDKSSMLFNKGRPQMLVEDMSGTELEDATYALNSHFDMAQFDEFLNNFDAVVRLLKTAIVLVQYDNEYGCFVFDTLHRGNCSVTTYGPKRRIANICYIVEKMEKGILYRTIDSEVVQDWYVEGDRCDLVNEEENIFGIVPAAVFHDTKVPRDGFWNYIPQDLVDFNVQYNLYLTDIIHAASYANRKTLYTNVNFEGTGDESQYNQEVYGEVLPRQQSSVGGILYGPDRIIQVDSMGVENPIIDFKGPDIKLEEIRNMFQHMVKDVASDWSVRIKVDGEGSANSGFQVVVEEMDNLELREKRQKNMEGGLARVYGLMVDMINIAEAREVIPADSMPHVEFNAPSLPYEKEKLDQMWINRIDNGLASRIDYIQDKYNLDREAAEAMLKQIDEDNAQNPNTVPGFLDEV